MHILGRVLVMEKKARKNILKLCKEDPLIMIFQEVPCHKQDHLLPGMDLMRFFSCSKFDHKDMDCRRVIL